MILAVLVTPADEPDRHMAAPLLAVALRLWRGLRLIWADSAYTGSLLDWLRARWRGRVRLQIVRRRVRVRGFRVQPKRWIVERTFGWLTRARRLVKDYERNQDHSEAFIYVRMTMLLLRRLSHAMDCLRHGDTVLLSTHAAFRRTHHEHAVQKGLRRCMGSRSRWISPRRPGATPC